MKNRKEKWERETKTEEGIMQKRDRKRENRERKSMK